MLGLADRLGGEWRSSSSNCEGDLLLHTTAHDVLRLKIRELSKPVGLLKGNMFQNLKHKFPFNKPTGFDSSQVPVATLVDEMVEFIMRSPAHIFNKVKDNMNIPLTQDPMSLLHTLQMTEP